MTIGITQQLPLDWPDRTDIAGALVAAILVNVVGGAPAVLGGPDSAWFASLSKPVLYPPDWVFGVAWTILFTLIGVAVYLVYREGSDRREVRIALGLFVVQMALNVAWTPTFFVFQRLDLALLVVGALWVVLLPTIRAFGRVSKRAAVLLIPYLLWVTFAAYLNAQFIILNFM